MLDMSDQVTCEILIRTPIPSRDSLHSIANRENMNLRGITLFTETSSKVSLCSDTSSTEVAPALHQAKVGIPAYQTARGLEKVELHFSRAEDLPGGVPN